MEHSNSAPQEPAPPRRWPWALAAAALALLPLSPGLSGARVFYIRDLSLHFWGRYLWLRRAWQSGEFPLWDPYVGAGQSAVSDALHQMFLLPAVLVRLVGTEVLGFNLWVALPFPLAALGAWLFFSRRFSSLAAVIAAVAFTLCGPVYATTNFPNMSWTVAAIPWVFLAADRLTAQPSARGVGWLALAVAGQAVAGEPVTQLSTLLVVSAYVPAVAACEAGGWTARLRRSGWAAAGIILGMLLAAVQLIPLAHAASQSMRGRRLQTALFWSLHPLGLVETVAPGLFGDYYASQSLQAIPWVPVINSGREPFFFSLYFGIPLLTLALWGFVSGGSPRWRTFWLWSGLASLLAAAGNYTAVYPALTRWLPILASFRFPAKYIVIGAFALAAGAAAGWDAWWTSTPETNARRRQAAYRAALVGLACSIVLSGGLVAAVRLFPHEAAFAFFSVARGLGSGLPVEAAEYMLKALPLHAAAVLLLSLVTLLLLRLSATGHGRMSALARPAFAALVVGDLLLRAWPINPTFDPVHLHEPQWLAMTKVDPHTRFYVGGKRDGTLDASDEDASRAFLNPPGLTGSASRAALAGQTAFYPSAWRGREALSYDLAVLWPKTFHKASREFFEDSVAAERERFLTRTGVRFRVLPASAAGGRPPLMKVPYYLESSLYDFGPEVAARVSVVPRATVVRDPEAQVHALFNPLWDEDTVLVTRDPVPAGIAGVPAAADARVVLERSNRLVIDAAAAAGGGYLVVLDSYADGWVATVDGTPADLVRANGLFRAVRLHPGRHRVEFSYRPENLVTGTALSGGTLILILGLMVCPASIRQPRVVAVRRPAVSPPLA